MPQLTKVLTRADVPTLESLIGAATVNVLHLLDEGLIRTEILRDILLNLKSPDSLFLNRSTWSEIVDLLSPIEASNLLATCGQQPAKDPWGVLRNIKIRKGSALMVLVRAYFEITTEEPEPEVDIDPEIVVSAEYSLFTHQRYAARNVSRLLNDGPRRVVLHMPTGSGKTRTAMHVICNHLLQNEKTLVIWLAYSDELCEQAATEFESAWGRLGNRDLTLARFWGKYEAEIGEISDGFVVAGLGKAYARAIDDIQFGARLGERVSLIVIDEAHQAIAPTYKLLLDSLQAKGRGSAILGLTATPGRSWDDLDADRELSDFFARKKVTLQVSGYTSPIDYLVEQGYLARPEFRDLLHEGGGQLSERDMALLESELEIPKRILEQLAEDEQRNLKIVSEIEKLSSNHGRIIVFAPSVQNAIVLASVLEARGHAAARSVTGATPKTDRQRYIRWYLEDSAEPRVLCNYGVLTTGFDAPATSAVLIARPTKSLVLYSQMVGRAIRGKRAGGNDQAEIVTIVDTSLPGFRNLAESFSNWEDAGWDTI